MNDAQYSYPVFMGELKNVATPEKRNDFLPLENLMGLGYDGAEAKLIGQADDVSKQYYFIVHSFYRKGKPKYDPSGL